MKRTVAIVGAGPAGIYAADILQDRDPEVRIDLFEKLPAPYGLVRYGVSPDHPRIKKIQDALHDVLENPRISFHGNVTIGTDITVDELREAYDAVIISTGADRDAELKIDGIDLPGSFGGADFVAWYDGHPDAPREWPLEAESVAVIGAGNVALDVTRMIIKHAEHLDHTDIPDSVESALKANRVRDVHLFIRRGPADVRFSALELRELGAQHDVDVIVDPADLELDEHGERMVKQFTQRRIMMKTFTEWAAIDPASREASRRVHLHFYQQPARVLGEHAVTGIEFDRTQPDELGRVTPTGERVTYDVQAVYRTVGYRSSPVTGVPFSDETGTIPEQDGRVLAADGTPIAGLYVTGWIRRGPIGLIGSTKSDAAQTIGSLLDDLALAAGSEERAARQAAAAEALSERLRQAVTWEGWLQLDHAERTLGSVRDRERTKIVERHDMLHHAQASTEATLKVGTR
ncbi:FAD-dependent oxidoreductase [Leucobacter sp. UCMA 4100]|uniref:FAD-dependent oxidoreductase n=1 Tax=Leucobacter sp. UCMA 4100 TaxID=2810534 RepID=UPI0022EB103C|nr:FAD-dependent oxidoreductase [Leucobacter sp. UCMA 4100]MDA3146473.1 FAD-dependent oxidoreductase [Leucobacter sp. UCMA 4100]